MQEGKTIQSVAKAMKLLDILAASSVPLSLAEISTLTGWPKSTIHGLLSTMRETSVVSQDEEGKRDEMDALLPIPEKIRNLCTMKSLETSAGPAKLLTSDPLTGEVFDTSFFIESELFVAVLFVEVVTFSEVHLSGE